MKQWRRFQKMFCTWRTSHRWIGILLGSPESLLIGMTRWNQIAGFFLIIRFTSNAILYFIASKLSCLSCIHSLKVGETNERKTTCSVSPVDSRLMVWNRTLLNMVSKVSHTFQSMVTPGDDVLFFYGRYLSCQILQHNPNI